MSSHVDTGATDQTIVFYAFDVDGVAVEVTTSDTITYRVDTNGREGTPVSMSLVARLVAGTHRDNALTYKGSGKHEVDLPDASVASAGEVSLEVTKSGVASVYVEKLEVSGQIATLLTRIIGTLASGTHQPQSGDAFARLGAPAGASVSADIAAIDGGGGGGYSTQLAAIQAKTDLITSQTANQTRTPINTFAITRGDSFTSTQAVTTNYTGYTATFTIRHRVTDAVLCTASATVTSSTLLTVTLTTTNTAFALLVDPTEFGPHPYDIRLVSGAIEKTESGVAIISRDMTRA